MFQKTLITASLAILVVGTALAKGPFQAQGVISDVQKDGEEIVFRYTGSMSLDYATAAATSPKNQWKTLTFDVAGVVVRIRHWTRRNEPSTRAQVPDTDLVFMNLSRLATSDKTLLLSIDNPSLTFSNRGQLVAITGTYVYAIESPY